jgi:hypothetical protein
MRRVIFRRGKRLQEVQLKLEVEECWIKGRGENLEVEEVLEMGRRTKGGKDLELEEGLEIKKLMKVEEDLEVEEDLDVQ